MEGFYSIAPSQASSMSRTPCNVVVDFIAPPNGKLRSLYGMAGVWDSGQLTSNHIVMRESVFTEFIGSAMEPYTGVMIQVANGDPLDIVGQVQIGLAMPGLNKLQPTIVDMMICKSLSSNFLMGRKMMNEWNMSIHYLNGTETWQAGEQRVPAKTANEALVFNDGLKQVRYLAETQRDGTRALIKINPLRGASIRYQWADISQGRMDPPPLKQARVQSVQKQNDSVPIPRSPTKKGNPPISKTPADPPQKPCPTSNIENGNKSGKP